MKLKYIHHIIDRHGHERHYFRRKGYASLTLPGEPGSRAFMDAYAAALQDKISRSAGSNQTGTVAATVAGYFSSVDFVRLAPSSQRARRRILEIFREKHGVHRIADFRRENIELGITTRADTPAAAEVFLKAMRALFRHAIAAGLRHDDPTVGVKAFKRRGEGIHSWSEDEIATFEARHQLGSKARLAFDLMLYTAQRRSDVVKMGRQHLQGNALYLRQKKTGEALIVPLHPNLMASIEATPSTHMTFLTTGAGKPYAEAGFGNWFRDRCNEAGLPQCSAHGLRKASLRRLAEAGCSAKEMQAISGHRSLVELEGYVRAADQARMARQAIATVTAAFKTDREQKVETPR